jgi:glutathione peroxidase
MSGSVTCVAPSADAGRSTGVAMGHDRGMGTLPDVPLRSLTGEPAELPADTTLLIVNVASRCGLTPQYEGLQRLHEKYAGRGFSVLGFPCNQFHGQEPGTAEQIAEFCTTSYGVTFPMFEKIDVNGPSRHELYAALTQTPDAEGAAGDVQWNFEKFLVSPDRTVLARFRPRTTPEASEIVTAIEAALPR